MRESLLALLKSTDKENRMSAIEMNKGLHLIDYLLDDYRPYTKILGYDDIEEHFINKWEWDALNISEIGLHELPPLPKSLRTLICSENPIKQLPPLPKRLKTLYCHSCLLTSLPPLPPSLTDLDCTKNKLKQLPPIPPRLEALLCSENYLKELPPLPSTLTILQAYDNPLSPAARKEIIKVVPNAYL